ncbi:hypothetical protein PG275_09920 [Riemerella anatipestifer]|uniref:hypothetical protein n=1 Tax=Riemerella anatipestifer TaxID=34085 RepID=UPI002A8B0E12|nr:hypothetical protein [Riemerella anatipestifer]
MNKKLKIGIILVWLIFINYLNRDTLMYKPLLSSSFIQKEIVQGRIINEKNPLRRGFLTGAFTYSYCFEVENIVYTNDSYNEKYEVGDIVLVEYSKKFPFMNRIVEK